MKFTGVYGDVQRVKILYNKKDSALIQMAEPHQAYLGKFEKIYIFLPIPVNSEQNRYIDITFVM